MKPLQSRLRHARLALPIIVLLVVAAVPLHRAAAVRLARSSSAVNVYLPLVSVHLTPPLLFQRDQGGNGEIYLMKPDGSGQTNLTNNSAWDGAISWSPRNRKIAFISDRDGHDDIYTMNLDGSGQTNLTNTPRDYRQVAWSPDGTKIAFAAFEGQRIEIYVMNADGSGQTKLTNDRDDGYYPRWSPDSTRIAFLSSKYNMYVMQADGSHLTQINQRLASGVPAWSPDGQQIAFQSLYEDPDCPASPRPVEIVLARPDGSGLTRLTHTKGSCVGGNTAIAAWQPLAWSPSGDRIAFANMVKLKNKPFNVEIYTINADGSNMRNVTSRVGIEQWPAWSPLGDRLAFSSSLDANGISYAIFIVNADGSGLQQLSDGSVPSNSIPVWAE